MMKNEIRLICKNKRKEMTKEDVERKSISAQNAFLDSRLYKDSRVIMLYYPIGNETDTRLIAKTAFSDGKRLVYPVTDEKTGEITPFYADENNEFHIGAFSVPEPEKKNTACKEDIDIVIVPGIAFGSSGARIGFGKGCYDRFLKNIKAVKAGFCYDFQVCGGFAGEEHDISMDFLITESGVRTCE